MQQAPTLRQLWRDYQRKGEDEERYKQKLYRMAEREALREWWACTVEEEREAVRRRYEPWLSTGLVKWKKAQVQMKADRRRILEACDRRGIRHCFKKPY